MRVFVGLAIVALVLLTGGAAPAQEPKGWLGADLKDITKEEAEKLGWEAPRGAKVVRPIAGGPAASAGVLPEDIITTFDGQDVESVQALIAGVSAKAAGAQVRLRVVRAGRERTVTVTLSRRPAELAQPVTQKEDRPILMLDTGGHMAAIHAVTFTPDGKQLVSAGRDKVVRVWDWQSGKTVRTIRGQVGQGPEGMIYDIALSPDGRWLAVGGYLGTFTRSKPPEEAEGAKIRIYDFTSGKLVVLLNGHTKPVLGLAFSPDGKQLISSGGFDRSAIIWDVERRTLVHRLQGHKEQIYAVGFTPDGARAVTGSHDTTLKLWSVNDGKEIATLAGHMALVRSLTVSPADGTIASGAHDGEIRLWDGRTGRFLRTVATQNRSVPALRFSIDGKLLLSGMDGQGMFLARVWDVATGNEVVAYRNDNIVLAVAVSPDGRLAVTGCGASQVRIWDIKTGESKKVLQGTGTEIWAVGFSADGQRIAWGNRWQLGTFHPSETDNPLLFQLRLPVGTQRLGEPEQIDGSIRKELIRARRVHGPYTLTHRPGGGYGFQDAILDVKKDGRTPVSIERLPHDGYNHKAYSFTPDGQTIISGGGNGVLTAYDLKGTKLGQFVGHESDVWAVTPSPDGRLLISGSNDQTVRLWNLKTREPIVTLFHGTDGEWVMWTPQGYYTGSPGADKIVGWQINKGPDQAADHVGADQLRQHLHRPDIVERAIILASAEQAVREAPGTSFKLADLLKRPVPRFKIVGSTRREGGASVKIAIEATPDPVTLIRVQVIGRHVEEQTPPSGSGGFGAVERYLHLPLASGRNEISVTLSNAIGSKTGTLVLTHDGEGDLDKRGTLHILAIGVDDYKGLGNACGKSRTRSCDLSFASADARRFVATIEKALGPGHLRVEKRVLINGGDANDAPTVRNINDAVDRLRRAEETDTVVLFIAGHGINDGPDYRFLPTDAEMTGGTLKGSTVVPWQVLQSALEAAKGRRLLFVDTCRSGNAYNQRLGNNAYHANIIAFTASRLDQEAIEDPKLGHGLFTFAVTEALEGKGDLAGRRQITTKDMADYIKGRVATLAKSLKGEQEPQYFKGRDAQDFVLVR